MIAYRVWSEDFNGELLSDAAYSELLCHMSTADFALHRSKITMASSTDAVVTVDWLFKNLGIEVKHDV